LATLTISTGEEASGAIAASVGTMSGVALQSNVPPRSVSAPVTVMTSSVTSTVQPIALRMSRNPASPCAVGTASPRTRILPRVAAAAANQYEAEE
jgi:hypothetical protein